MKNRIRILWSWLRAFVLYRLLRRPPPEHIHTDVEELVAMTLYATAIITVLKNAPRITEMLRSSGGTFADILGTLSGEEKSK